MLFVLAALVTAGDQRGHAQAGAPLALTPAEMTFSTEGLAMAGMSQAKLVGDPSKTGPYTVRLRFPDGYEMGPHTHNDSREVTILSGTWLTAYGDKFDASALKALPAGSFYIEPANVVHYVRTGGPVVIQVSGIGPSQRTFLPAK